MRAVCPTHIHAWVHIWTQKERESLPWPRYCSLQGPYPSLGNRCGTKRGGDVGGGEQYERRTNGLAAPKGIGLLAPFSHYSTVCVHFRLCSADIILQNFKFSPKRVREAEISVLILIGLKYDRRNAGMIKRVIVWCWSAKMREKRLDDHIQVAVCVHVHHLTIYFAIWNISHPPLCVCVCVYDVLAKARQWSGCTAHYGHTHTHGGNGHSDCDSCWWSNILRASPVGRCPQAHTHTCRVVSCGFLVIALGIHSEVMSETKLNCLSIFILSFHPGYFYVFFHWN